MRTIACLFLGPALFVTAGMAAGQMTRPPQQNRDQVQSMDPYVRKAIEFERAKARAAARQKAIEARHPTVFYNSSEGRSTDQNSANRVIDPGPRATPRTPPRPKK